MWFGDANPQPEVAEYEGIMHLNVITPNDEGCMPEDHGKLLQIG